MATREIKPGQRIRVFQEIDRREGNWVRDLVGTVLSVRPEKTGSWHAHGKNDKLWLNRIRLRKEDGEITTVVIDQHTRLEVLADTPSP
jgi:hypothetical protein